MILYVSSYKRAVLGRGFSEVESEANTYGAKKFLKV